MKELNSVMIFAIVPCTRVTMCALCWVGVKRGSVGDRFSMRVVLMRSWEELRGKGREARGVMMGDGKELVKWEDDDGGDADGVARPV